MSNRRLTHAAISAIAAGLLAGCSGSSALTTGSLFGSGDKAKVAAATPPPPRNDPVARAFQVGAVSARAEKCGFNFDPQRLKANFLAGEMALGSSPDEMARVEKLYTTTRNTVAKAIAGESEYCSPERLSYIRGDLKRHLAGDFTPGQPKSFAKDEGGLLSFGASGEDGDEKL